MFARVVLIIIGSLEIAQAISQDDDIHIPKPQTCEDEWVRFENKCFRVYEKKVTFPEAIDACHEEYQAELATVNSKQEQLFIRQEIYRGIEHKSIWIGGIRTSFSNSNEDFSWLGGKKFTFTAWDHGEPNNYNDVENCVAMIGHSRTECELWVDVRCDQRNWALCQKPLGSPYADDQVKESSIMAHELYMIHDKLLKVYDEREPKSNVLVVLILLGVTIISLLVIVYCNGDFTSAGIFFSETTSNIFKRFENEREIPIQTRNNNN